MFKKSSIIILIGICAIVIVSVLSYVFFIKPEPVVPIQSVENNDVVSTTTTIENNNILEIDTFKDKTYFFSAKDKMVEWKDSKGNIHKLTFTKAEDSTYSDSFIISPDDQKIVWVETKETYQDNKHKMNSKLMFAHIDGQNKKVLLEKNFNNEDHFRLITWSNLDDKEIYFWEEPGGIGGYIIFGGPFNLSKINIYTGKIEYLSGEKGIIKDFGSLGDISPDEKYISYFNNNGDNPKLIIRNMETGEKNIFNIPIEEKFTSGGNAFFSPDGKHVVYNIAHHDPNDEYYRVIVVSSTKKEQKTIVDDFQKEYEVMGWVSNDEILLRNFDDTYYIIDIDGTNLRKK